MILGYKIYTLTIEIQNESNLTIITDTPIGYPHF